MTFGHFTVEEINLIAMYLENTRTDTITAITDAISYMDDDMITIAESAIYKLSRLNEQEYADTTFTPTDETEE